MLSAVSRGFREARSVSGLRLSYFRRGRVIRLESAHVSDELIRVGPRGTEPNLRICRKKSQIQHAVATAVARTSGRSDRPASDPEMDTLEVTGYIAFLNVVALKNKPDHQVDADGERR